MLIDQKIYNGDLIHNRFAYEHLRKKVSATGDIVSFIAPMDVTTNLIDLEDTLSNDYIWSDLAFNFCWEIPNLCPLGAVAFQRWFNANISSILKNYILCKQMILDGDDILVDAKKASVSITYSKNNVAIGHTGINIIAGAKAPDFAYSTYITDPDEQMKFIKTVEDCFYDAIADMFIATTKVIV